MREQGKRLSGTYVDSISLRPGGYRVPTVHKRGELGTSRYLYSNVRGTWRRENHITYKEFARSIAIILASGGTFGYGLGELIYGFAMR